MPQNNPSTFAEFARIMRDMVRNGTIAEIKGDRVRVKTGDLVTDWLPWSNVRAGAVKISSRPSVGEQCTILAENGNLNAGKVYPGVNSDANPIPADCGPNDLVIDIPPGGKLLLRCGGSTLEMTENGIKLNATRIDLN